MLRARSAEGLSALSFELESWGLLVHATYGYLRGLPFSAYGEAVMMLAQNVLLLALVYKYARMPASRALAAIVVGVSAVAGIFTGGWWVVGFGSPACSGIHSWGLWWCEGSRKVGSASQDPGGVTCTVAGEMCCCCVGCTAAVR